MTRYLRLNLVVTVDNAITANATDFGHPYQYGIAENIALQRCVTSNLIDVFSILSNSNIHFKG
jgi:hypothetical protein